MRRARRGDTAGRPGPFARARRLVGLAAALVGLAAALVGLCSCATRSYERPVSAVPDALFRVDAPLPDDDSIAALPWPALFSDPVLRELIADGLARNLDLQIALARIDVARANLAQSGAAFLPTLQADARYVTTKQPNLPLIRGVQLTASSTWEADLWGKLRSARRASRAQLYASWAFKHAVRTQLIADVANTYYAILAYERQLALTEEAVAIRVRDVETVRALKDAAVVTGADVVQSEANRYAAEVTIPDIKRNIRELENALSVLLARPPGRIPRTTLDEQATLASLRPGVPAQLLANRPDVLEAEYAFRSQFELTNVARAYFYPALTLSGSAGFANPDPADLFSPSSVIGNFIGGLTQPILNQGVNVQRLRVARARQREAFFTFHRTLLRAGQEVSDALFAYETAVAKAEARRRQIEALGKAVEFTKDLLRYTSNTNYVDVLTSEQSLLAAQINGVNDRLQQLQAVVNLYRALGGGWR